MKGMEYFDHLLNRLEQLVNSNTKKADRIQQLTNEKRVLNTKLQTALAELQTLRNERDKDLPTSAD